MNALKQMLAGKLTERDQAVDDSFEGFLKSLKVTECFNAGGDVVFFEDKICLGVLSTDGTILVNEHNCSPAEASRRFQEIKSRREQQERWDRKADYAMPLQQILSDGERKAKESGGSRSSEAPRSVQASLTF